MIEALTMAGAASAFGIAGRDREREGAEAGRADGEHDENRTSVMPVGTSAE